MSAQSKMRQQWGSRWITSAEWRFIGHLTMVVRFEGRQQPWVWQVQGPSNQIVAQGDAKTQKEARSQALGAATRHLKTENEVSRGGSQ